MILIAEGGSTKCDWAGCSKFGDLIFSCQTVGFNPKYISSNNVLSELEESDLRKIKNQVTKLIFYGAGCSNKKRNRKLKGIFSKFFRVAKIKIKHDLEAAYLATYDKSPIICSILGTGSNSCFYDGEKLIENAPSLGYILGDEGSGNYFGKKIVNLYVNNQLPEDLVGKFEKWIGLTKEELIEKIYDSERPNLYLASFFKFMVENKKRKIFNDLFLDGLRTFFELHICCFKNYTKHPLTFVGSVAYYLSEHIEKVAIEYDCKVDQILQSPIHNLINVYFKK